MEARRADRLRQEQWEREHGPAVPPDPAPGVSTDETTRAPVTKPLDPLSPAEQAKVLGAVVAEQADFLANDTLVSSALPPEVGPAIHAARTAAELYAERELLALQAAEALEQARKIAGQVRDDLVAKGREAGLAAGEAMGQAVRQVYGDQLDPVTEMKIREAIAWQQRQEQQKQRTPPPERPPAPER